MTREEAVDIIINEIETRKISHGIALNMAIEALKEPKQGECTTCRFYGDMEMCCSCVRFYGDMYAPKGGDEE